MIEWAIQVLLVDQWAVITGAPIGFCIAILVVGFGIWKIVNWHYSGTIRTLNAHLAFTTDLRANLETQVKDLRDAEKSAKDEIAKFEARINQIPQPPRELLDASQRTAGAIRVLTSAQAGLANTASDILTLTDPDALQVKPFLYRLHGILEETTETKLRIFYVRRFQDGMSSADDQERVEAVSARAAAEHKHGGQLVESDDKFARTYYQVRGVDQPAKVFGFTPAAETGKKFYY